MVTPRGFGRQMKRFGIQSSAVAEMCRFQHKLILTGCQIGQMRWQKRPLPEVRCALIRLRDYQRDELFRNARRARAEAQWPPEDTRREIVRKVAAELDKATDAWLGDWLLRAKPEALAEVAAGVSVHALLRGRPDAWDALMEADIADYPKASDWYDDVRDCFVWAPSRNQLYA